MIVVNLSRREVKVKYDLLLLTWLTRLVNYRCLSPLLLSRREVKSDLLLLDDCALRLEAFNSIAFWLSCIT